MRFDCRPPAGLVVWLSMCAGPVPALAGERLPVTFNDVAPIIFEHCSSCHRPGEVAPFDLLTYEDVRSRARLIADATERRFMPPWMPEEGQGEFDGSRRLSNHDIQTIRQWVDDGALEGDAGRRPAPPVFSPGWQLGVPDVVLTMPEAFVLRAAGPDVFRNFVLPVPVSSRRYVRAVEFRPGPTRAIHHARMLIDESRQSRWQDANESGVGFGGMDAPGAHFPDGHFLGWAAGKSPSETDLPWSIGAGIDLVVQTHLKPTGRDEPVQVSIGLYFADKPPASVPVMVRLGTRTFDIPPGASDYVVTDSYDLPVDVELRRIYPHAHYLGKEMTITARFRDGRVEPLLHIANWDFNWQDDYEYANPVPLPRGTTVTMRYVYDNSAANPHNPQSPPAPVAFGPDATDEMADLLLQVVPRRRADFGTLKADVTRKALLTDIAGEEKRLTRVPDDVDALNALGVHYMQTGREDEAIARFNAALRVSPTLAVANYNLAVVAMSRGDLQWAASAFERALAARPDYTEAHTNYGVLLQRTGRPDEAMSHFRATLALKPDNPVALNNLGRALLVAGRPDDALQQFRALVSVQPDSAPGFDGLAMAYAATERMDMALRAAQQALSRALAAKNSALARDIRRRLDAYQRQIESEAAFP